MINRTRASSLTDRPIVIAIALAFLVWAACVLLFIIRDFNFVVSDAEHYWIRTEHAYDMLFNGFHVPLYPMLLLVVRIFLPFLSPSALMLGFAIVVWLLTVRNVLVLLRGWGVQAWWQMGLLFAFFPFVGTAEMAFPRADPLVYLFMTMALLAYRSERRWQLILILAGATLVHKGLWIFVGALIIIGWAQRRLNFFHAVVIMIPLGLLWVYGIAMLNDPLWLLSKWTQTNADRVIADPRPILPLFDGLYANLRLVLGGSITDIVQMTIIAGVMIALVFLFFWLLRTGRWKTDPLLVAVLLPSLIFTAILPIHEVWAVVRFAKLLVIPLGLWLNEHPRFNQRGLWEVILLGSIVTQIGFTYYYTVRFQ